jgi:chromosome segregation ATPase
MDDDDIKELQAEIRQLKKTIDWYYNENRELNGKIEELEEKIEEQNEEIIDLQLRWERAMSEDDVFDEVLPPHLVENLWARETVKKLI